jgi:hypothetical protein
MVPCGTGLTFRADRYPLWRSSSSNQTRDTGGAGAGALGDSLAKPELARKFHDNAVRSLPEERAVEIAARTLALPDPQSVEDLTALLSSAGERRGRDSYRSRTA